MRPTPQPLIAYSAHHRAHPCRPAKCKVTDSPARALRPRDGHADKFKLAQQQPVFRKRAELAAQIPRFWSKSLENCKATAQFIDPVDQDALKALKEVEITHGDDVREYDIKFVSCQQRARASLEPSRFAEVTLWCASEVSHGADLTLLACDRPLARTRTSRNRPSRRRSS